MRSHTYQPPLEVSQAVPEYPAALKMKLPNPPNGDPEDEVFLFRKEGTAFGYFNRCGHIQLPLDLDDSRFFDSEGMLICRVHGARFDESTGACIMGPAYTGLFRLRIQEGPALMILGWEGPVPPRQ